MLELGYRGVGMRRDVLLHVFSPRIAKDLRGQRSICSPPGRLHHLPRRPDRILSVFIHGLDTPRSHRFEAHNHDAIRHSVGDHFPCHMQPC